MEGEQSGNGGNITNLILMPAFLLTFSPFMTAQFAVNIIIILLSSQVMYYLSELVGGATAFPILGLAATPKPGTAVFW